MKLKFMKKNILYLLIAIIAFGSCEKKDNPEPNPPAEDTYINATAGSTWKYHETNSSRVLRKNQNIQLPPPQRIQR